MSILSKDSAIQAMLDALIQYSTGEISWVDCHHILVLKDTACLNREEANIISELWGDAYRKRVASL